MEDQNYQWVERLLDTDSKTMGVYLALLYLRVWKRKTPRIFLPTEITEEKEFKRLFASYLAGKENVGEALDAARNFANSVISSLSSFIYDRRNQILEEIECRFFLLNS